MNDVAAMKVADCGLALLNGYGVESMSKSNSDVENERRLQKIGQRRIGSNRRRNKQLDANTLAGIGNTRKANSLRLGAEMEAALLEIRKKAAARQGISDPDQAELSLGDIKAHFAAIWALNKKERLRATLLRKGGAGAARVLAEDDMKRNDTDDNCGASEIRTGEASLVSSFSCLRPAIDGVDALLRTGASASASTMATMKNIGLQSLMNCYNLASLYKNGFRYGKHMWSVESAIYMSISQASCSSSFSPRPRLSGVLAEMSLFHPANAMSAFAQAFIHLATLTVGVRMGNYLEKLETPETKSLKRKIKTIDRAANTNPLITETLVKALLEAPVVAAGEEEVEKKEKGFFGIFYRPPFKPNYTTNFVFLMSIFQYAVSELVNHRGKPFYGSILESRQLTASIGMSILFPVLMLLDAFPVFSDMLELKKMPSKKAKASVLLIFLLDLIGCLVSSKLASSLLEAPAKTDPKSSKNVSSKQCAADEEEKILAEESKANAVFASVLLMSGMYFVVKNILL